MLFQFYLIWERMSSFIFSSMFLLSNNNFIILIEEFLTAKCNADSWLKNNKLNYIENNFIKFHKKYVNVNFI